jgi:hypothetical protein
MHTPNRPSRGVNDQAPMEWLAAQQRSLDELATLANPGQALKALIREMHTNALRDEPTRPSTPLSQCWTTRFRRH